MSCSWATTGIWQLTIQRTACRSVFSSCHHQKPWDSTEKILLKPIGWRLSSRLWTLFCFHPYLLSSSFLKHLLHLQKPREFFLFLCLASLINFNVVKRLLYSHLWLIKPIKNVHSWHKEWAEQTQEFKKLYSFRNTVLFNLTILTVEVWSCCFWTC